MLPAKLCGKDRQCSIGVDSGLWGGNTGLSSASCRTQCLSWVFPEADPRTRVRVQGVYLGGHPRKHQWESGEVKRGRDATNKGAYQASYHHGKLLLDSTGGLWESVWNAHLRILPDRWGNWGIYTLVEGCSQVLTPWHLQPPFLLLDTEAFNSSWDSPQAQGCRNWQLQLAGTISATPLQSSVSSDVQWEWHLLHKMKWDHICKIFSTVPDIYTVSNQ